MTFDRRITPHRPDLADERLRGQVEAERFAAGTPERVIAPSAPLRRHPSPDAPLDTEALMGERVTVYDEHEGWAWAQLDTDGYVGYVPTAALGEPGPAPTHRIAPLRTFLFPGPNLKLPPLGFVSLGARVAVVARGGRLRAARHRGFVYAPHLAPLDAGEPDFVAVAERFLHALSVGRQDEPRARLLGPHADRARRLPASPAPRDSDMQQAELGHAVEIGPDLAGLARGDLVFWKRPCRHHARRRRACSTRTAITCWSRSSPSRSPRSASG